MPPCHGGDREFESLMVRQCGSSSMVEPQPSKLITRVRFPSPAPGCEYARLIARAFLKEMNIKQQKQIKRFLITELGKVNGSRAYDEEARILDEIVNEIDANKTKAQRKTLIQTILPRIALYKELIFISQTKEEAYEIMGKYILDIVGQKKHKMTARLEHLPGFFKIYRNVFLKIMRTTDLQVSTQKAGKDYFDITIRKCLWHTACVENNCPELCRLFCDIDHVTYGNLKKMGFERSKTLGYDGDCCDFHFFKK